MESQQQPGPPTSLLPVRPRSQSASTNVTQRLESEAEAYTRSLQIEQELKESPVDEEEFESSQSDSSYEENSVSSEEEYEEESYGSKSKKNSKGRKNAPLLRISNSNGSQPYSQYMGTDGAVINVPRYQSTAAAAPSNPQQRLTSVLSQLATLPAEEQAKVLSKILTPQSVQGSSATAIGNSQAVKQAISKMIYERTLQKLTATNSQAASQATNAQPATPFSNQLAYQQALFRYQQQLKMKPATPTTPAATVTATRLRPKRNLPSKKEEEEEIFSSDSESSSSNEEESNAIEKFLSYRRSDFGEEQFFCKFKGKSFLHTRWLSRQSLIDLDANNNVRIKRFLRSLVKNLPNSDLRSLTTVDKILAEHPESDHFLVRWLGQPYESCTWEPKALLLESAANASSAIEEFQLKRQKNSLAATDHQQQPFTRPPKSVWKRLEESPVFENGRSLRSYQLEGVNWLTWCWFCNQSCILADEMGLGKTVQTISFLRLLRCNYSVPGPFLIVAPLSTLPHWERELRSWCPTMLRSVTYHGSRIARDVIYEYEFFTCQSSNTLAFDVLLTTYEMITTGISHLSPIAWRIAIFDEAHRLKGPASKATELLSSGYHIEHRVLATGTPVQNRLSELYSLLSFMDPLLLPIKWKGIAPERVESAEDVTRLQELLRPIMLRRLKEDVEKSIPIREETIVEVELTVSQRKTYRSILERSLGTLLQAEDAPIGSAMNTMMELRKCCIHPFLIDGAEARIRESESAGTGPATSEEDSMECTIRSSGKLVLLDKLLAKLRAANRKVLIFSQMTRCLDLLQEYLRYRKYPWERIDGTVRPADRQAAIDRFCGSGTLDAFCFLLCTRAGGVGINLTAADTVVIFDSDWNPQNDLQAMARCHRIGQTKEVQVYRLVTRGTYEREMFDRSGLKLGLDRALLGGGAGGVASSQSSNGKNALDRAELERLLRKGAYGVVMDADDEEGRKFCVEDIDQILERRTQVISTAATTGDVTKSGGSVFSKASFSVGGESSALQIDWDDPLFWERWAQCAVGGDRGKELLRAAAMDEPRQKRLMKRLRAVEVWSDTLLSELDEISEEGDFVEFLKSIVRFGVNGGSNLETVPKGASLSCCLRAVVRLCLGEHPPSSVPDSRFRVDVERFLLGGCAATGEGAPEDFQIPPAINDWLQKNCVHFIQVLQVLECFRHVYYDGGGMLCGNSVAASSDPNWDRAKDEMLVAAVATSGYLSQEMLQIGEAPIQRFVRLLLIAYRRYQNQVRATQQQQMNLSELSSAMISRSFSSGGAERGSIRQQPPRLRSVNGAQAIRRSANADAEDAAWEAFSEKERWKGAVQSYGLPFATRSSGAGRNWEPWLQKANVGGWAPSANSIDAVCNGFLRLLFSEADQSEDARSLVKAIEIFDRIQGMYLENVERVRHALVTGSGATAVRRSQGMPQWWQSDSVEHDAHLAAALLSHGLDGAKEILSDSTFPYSESVATWLQGQQQQRTKRRRSDGHTSTTSDESHWPNRQCILKRASAIVDAVGRLDTAESVAEAQQKTRRTIAKRKSTLADSDESFLLSDQDVSGSATPLRTRQGSNNRRPRVEVAEDEEFEEPAVPYELCYDPWPDVLCNFTLRVPKQPGQPFELLCT